MVASNNFWRAVKPTIKDVASEAGVSLGTASRVINNYSDVNPEMKQRVERAIAKLGYTPDAVAQGMRLRTTRTIGILIRDFSAPAFVHFAAAAQSILYREGYVPLLATYDDEPRRELEIMRAFAGRRIDGLIITTSTDKNETLSKARKALGVPTVFLDRDADKEQDTIAIDHRTGIQRALAYLFGLGHARVALVTGPLQVRPAKERVAAYRKAHTAAGHRVDTALIRAGSFSAEFARQQTAELLALPEPPTAILAGGVLMLPGVLRAIRAAGLRIPADISVISSTNPEIAELITPTITELQVDFAAMGIEASKLILGRLQGSITGPPRVLHFDTQLIHRESCGAPPAADKGSKRKRAK
ncbi:LacI family DNA-binding transcriptional regulator [Delftia sp. Cs1-4]|uniref:LacI family DNA-binding transcriptional regulator n=1 Tax=Delftia sp. (strain Cs1-4) TaxID=742013 RepID=UPI00155AA991|nr:LacI family DNA-binding transcriptional regulator [Delftia sp. Cs1-4]